MRESQKKAAKKYLEKFEDIKFRVEFGKKQIIMDYAKSKGMSLNAYINSLIDKDMNKSE